MSYKEMKEPVINTLEMEEIRQGLERFLQQEMKDMEGEQEEPTEAVNKTASKRRVLQDDTLEDWDTPKKKKTGSGRRGNDRTGQGRKGRTTGDRERKGQGTKSRITKDRGRREDRPLRPGKKKSRFRRFLIKAAILIAVCAAVHYYAVGMIYDKMNYVETASNAKGKAPLKEDGVVNILLIGNDSRENDGDGRSDAMILLSISNNTKKIYMTSLLRDMYVEIPGHDGNRLNAAYSFGGPELLMDTVEENLGVTVNHYVQVNFEAFANLVDAVGGVDLELSSEEVEYVNAYLWEYNILTKQPEGTDYMDTSLSGMLHLNGPQALAYSRNRYLGTDFGRTERQRKVLAEVIGKLPKALVKNPKGIMDGLLPNLTTNLTRNECYQLSFMAGKLLTYDLEQGSIPVEGSYRNVDIRGMAVMEVDFEANKEYLQEKLYGGADAQE